MVVAVFESILFIVSIFLFRKICDFGIKQPKKSILFQFIRLISLGWLIFSFFMGIGMINNNPTVFIVAVVLELILYLLYLYGINMIKEK